MRIRRSAAIVAMFVVAALPATVAGASPAGGGASADAAARAARHQAIVRHWTPARMKAAIPRDFLFDAVRGYHLDPKAKPGGGGGGNTTGASWPNGRGKIYRAVGKVYFEMGGGGYVCSGTALGDSRSDFSLVLTAGHCAYDETAGGSLSGFATNWLFIPQFDSNPTFTCGSTAFGCWSAEALVVNGGYARAGGFNNQAVQYDWAFAVVGAGGLAGAPSPQLDTTVGTFTHLASEMALNTVADAFGYPAAGKYRGKDLTYCQGPTTRDVNTGNATYRLACNMTGGSSGGSWLSDFNTTTGDTGTIQSLNSYGYSGQSYMYGPIFNSTTTQTYDAADGATTTNTIVN